MLFHAEFQESLKRRQDFPCSIVGKGFQRLLQPLRCDVPQVHVVFFAGIVIKRPGWAAERAANCIYRPADFVQPILSEIGGLQFGHQFK